MQRYSKFLTATIGFIAEIANANIFTGRTEEILTLVVSAVTALGVYAIPNTAPTATRTVVR